MNDKSDEYPIQGKSLFGRALEREILDHFVIVFNKLITHLCGDMNGEYLDS